MRFSRFQLMILDNGHVFEFLIVSCRLQDTSGCKASCKARRAGTQFFLMTSEAFPSQAQTFLHRYSNLICFVVLLRRELGWRFENKTLSNKEMS